MSPVQIKTLSNISIANIQRDCLTTTSGNKSPHHQAVPHHSKGQCTILTHAKTLCWLGPNQYLDKGHLDDMKHHQDYKVHLAESQRLWRYSRTKQWKREESERSGNLTEVNEGLLQWGQKFHVWFWQNYLMMHERRNEKQQENKNKNNKRNE